MKTKLRVLALLTSAMVLHGCGGGDMLGSSDAEDYKMTPDVVTEDLTRPRPSENAPVITTKGNSIYWADGRETIFRGINLQYSNAPLEMIDGFTGIAEIGANVVRIQLSKTTSEGELEAALNAAALNGLAAIITLNDPELKCHDDEVAFNNAVKDLWLDEWLPIIAQDRYQDKIMINMASGWGPKEVFNGYSFGYRTYIDTYKTAIRQFRKAGLKFPLVVDAPGCGEDYHAFESDRAKELMAADDQKNLIFSVHAYGSTWNTATKIVENMDKLTSQNVPVIMSEFGGSGVGESPVKLASILEKGAGDYAVDISVPWKSDADKLAMVLPLAQPIDITNSEVSFDVMLDGAYVTDGSMGVVMYLRDSSDKYANLGWHTAADFTADQWSTQKYTIKDVTSFNHADSGFDLTSVAKFGIELIANGKAPDVVGGIKVDNFKVIEGGGGPAVTYAEDFVGTTGDWVGTQWEGQPVGISVADGALNLTPQAAGLEAGIRGLTSAGVDFSAPVTINARIFFPESLGSEFNFTFYALDGAWTTTDYIGAWAVNLGEWNDISLTADFSEAGNSGIAIQMGKYPEAAWADAIKIDYIEVVSIPKEEASEVELGIQYEATFDADADNWVAHSWGDSAKVEVADGSLNITAKDFADRIDVQRNNPGNIEKLNLNDPFTFKTRIFIPAYYDGFTTLTVQFYLQDSGYANHFDVINLAYNDLVIGDWNNIDVEVAFPEAFNRSGAPMHMGFSFATSLESTVIGDPMSKTDPIKIDEIIFEGLIPVEKEEVLIGLVDFHYRDQLEALSPDYVEGALVADELTDIVDVYERSAPFSWAAWSWFGNDAEHADWDMTTIIDSALGLTERGLDIVLGKGGIVEAIGATGTTTQEEEVIEE